MLLQKEVAVGAPYQELAETLGSRLQQLGLWKRKEAGGQLLVNYSAGLVDQIGKMGKGAVGGGDVVDVQGT
jgi:hypothetical protein